MRVVLIVGTNAAASGHDPLHCGVYDYAQCLAQTLTEAGVHAQVAAPPSWALRDGLTWIRAIRQAQPDILHLQYPSIGHRYSLLPHGLGLTRAGRRCVVTLHEHSALPRVQRTANKLFRATAHQLIFTTDYEAKAFGAPTTSPVIPIGSNVPVHSRGLTRDKTVVYFGQIRPNKGIEDFLALARLSTALGEPWRFVVIGNAPPRWQDYERTLRAAAPVALEWVTDAALPMIAMHMASAAAAYLPFPDGAGLRRGSLLAAISNDLPVITAFGPSTTAALRAALLEADTPEAALNQLRCLRDTPSLGQQYAAKGRALLEPLNWTRIAQAHMALYQNLLVNHPQRNMVHVK